MWFAIWKIIQEGIRFIAIPGLNAWGEECKHVCWARFKHKSLDKGRNAISFHVCPCSAPQWLGPSVLVPASRVRALLSPLNNARGILSMYYWPLKIIAPPSPWRRCPIADCVWSPWPRRDQPWSFMHSLFLGPSVKEIKKYTRDCQLCLCSRGSRLCNRLLELPGL